MIVGVCRITLLIDESHSLKEKRMVLRRIKDRVRNHFNCAIAEVGEADAWQSSEIGFSVVSNDHGFTQAMVQKILAFIENLAVAKIVNDEQDYICYGDNLDSSGGSNHWEPEA
jgi:uncharacterized protein YlxP (DUF503 family)